MTCPKLDPNRPVPPPPHHGARAPGRPDQRNAPATTTPHSLRPREAAGRAGRAPLGAGRGGRSQGHGRGLGQGWAVPAPHRRAAEPRGFISLICHIRRQSWLPPYRPPPASRQPAQPAQPPHRNAVSDRLPARGAQCSQPGGVRPCSPAPCFPPKRTREVWEARTAHLLLPHQQRGQHCVSRSVGRHFAISTRRELSPQLDSIALDSVPRLRPRRFRLRWTPVVLYSAQSHSRRIRLLTVHRGCHEPRPCSACRRLGSARRFSPAFRNATLRASASERESKSGTRHPHKKQPHHSRQALSLAQAAPGHLHARGLRLAALEKKNPL